MKIFSITSIIIVLFSSSSWAAEKAVPSGNGRIAVYNYHEREYADIQYKDGGRIIPEKLKEINHLFRSRGDSTEHAIDIRLIELIDNIQKHFGADTIELVSGYRSSAYNKSLKLEGKGVAWESLHTLGRATDIHIDEVKEEEIFDYVKKLGLGGVGLYPRHDFVHVDVGPVRNWREKEPLSRILVGTENNPNPLWSAITDKNIYGRTDSVKISIKNNDYKKQRPVKNFWIEHFEKGKWSGQIKIDVDGEPEGLETGDSTEFVWAIPENRAFGKYRFVIFANKDFSIPPVFSNEFYIKK